MTDRTGTPLKIALAFALTLGPAAAGANQTDRFGEDERFESPFYGDLRTRDSDALHEPTPQAARATTASATTASASAGRDVKQAASVPQQFMPWSGTWWPRTQCELSFKDYSQGLSPLEKYDSIVASLYGRVPGAAAWEADPVHRHNYAPTRNQLDWGGHCNGLAAAAVLSPEPNQSFQVPLGSRPKKVKLNIAGAAKAKEYLFSDRQDDYRVVSGGPDHVELTIADMKGLLAETYMTTRTQQFQNRNLTGTRYDQQNVDPNSEAFRDIHPHYFHWILQEFVKKNGMPIVVEIDPHFPVNNHPLFKFESDARYDRGRRRYSVTTKCYFADYAKSAQYVGTNVMTRTYTYDLYQDESGRVVHGEWTGRSSYQHPDFVWIPVADAPRYGLYENASLDGDFVRWIFRQYGRNTRRQ